ncbi:MAG: SIS domain-containing protein [Acidimicrobiales bacterium]
MLDTLNMWDATASLPEQIREAAHGAASLETESLPSAAGISAVVVLGAGDGAFASEVVRAVSEASARVPVVVVRDRHLPTWVGPSTLVLAISWSGDSQDTVVAVKRTIELGAAVVVVSRGGELASIAVDAALPILVVPGGIPQARAALGALCVPPLVVLERIGVLDGVSSAIKETCSILSARRDDLASDHGSAAGVARRIGRSIPLIYGSSGVASVAAMRWKYQVNENAKTPAFYSSLPDASLHEIAGWGQLGDVTRQIVTLIALRHRREDPAAVRQFEFISEALDEVVAGTVELWSQAESDIAILFDLVLSADFVSLHLAREAGVDPGPVPIFTEMTDAIKEA